MARSDDGGERREPSFGGTGRSRDGLSLDRRDRIGAFPAEDAFEEDEPLARAPAKRTAAGPRTASSKASPAKAMSSKAPSSRSASAKAATPARRRAPKRSLMGRLVKGGLYWGAILAVWGVVAVAGVLGYYALTLPPTSEWAVPARPPNVRIVSETGETIANRGDTGGEALTLSEMPKALPQAVMAIEDRRFYSHLGIDPIGLARAMVVNFRSGAATQGGSTLTQQLAKNLFLVPERTIERKMQEVVLSIWLEAEHSKDAILEMYLNRVYLGAGAYGVDAAARRYFAKSARDVTIAEAAMIAGLLKAPSRYAPTNDLQAAQDRAALVLGAMREEGYITEAQLKQALAEPARIVNRQVAASAGYVADWVMDLVPGFVGQVAEDIVVETTIDTSIQRAAEDVLQTGLAAEGEKLRVSQGAVVVMDGAGAVKGLVGGRDYQASQFNRAVTARRQPGSAFKPFVYLTALEHGMTPETVRVDRPVAFGKWRPENYTRKNYGEVTLKRALANSLNTVAVQLGSEVGAISVVDTAHRLGITSALNPNLSIALGTSEVTLLELTAAYTPFANGGYGVVPHVIRRIKTEDGKLLYEKHGSGPGQVVNLAQIGQMNEMLSEALISGTAQRARIPGWPAGGKTGTSQDLRDAWFVGYTGYFTAGIWLGNDDGKPTKATGGVLPAALWGKLMARVHDGMQVAELPGAQAAQEAAVAAAAQIPVDGPSPVMPQLPAGATAGGEARAGSRVIPKAGGGDFLKSLFGG
jgi:penicillin-binding protein 1A